MVRGRWEGEKKKKEKENEKSASSLKKAGWPYIDGVVVSRRQESQVKAARIRRDPQSGIHYTTTGSMATRGGRRCPVAERRCNGCRFCRPANRHIYN